MNILITGGSASGKSALAERLAVQGPPPWTYIATMRPWGAEAQARIARHRALRRGKGFETLECYESVGALEVPAGGTVLLECLGNLIANLMFDESGRVRNALEEIVGGVLALAARCGRLIVVTNDVGRDGGAYEEGTRRYIEVLGRANAALAARFDTVLEAVCDIPVAWKGEKIPLPERRKEGSGLTLVIGGAASGKREYVKSLGYAEDAFADGVLDEKPVLDNLQDLVARCPDGDLLPVLLTKEIVICNEVGCGVVPLDPEERAYRERVGRLCVRLAEKADRVVRITCGIPMVVKETGRCLNG